MIRLLWVFLLVLSVSPVLAQSKEIDSLRAVLTRHLNYPHGQANALFVQSMLKFVKGDLKSNQALLKQALPKAQRSGDETSVSEFLVSLGMSVQGKQRLAGTLLMLLILAWSLLRNNSQKKRANALLQAQRDQTQQALAELKTTQTQLVQKEKMASLGELTAGIAHEIQNPLNFVNNFSEVSAEMVEELAQEQQSPQPDPALQTELLTDLKDNLHKILHHGQRASNIVKRMLEHSRNSTGDKQPTDLNALCEEYLRLAYHGLRAKTKTFNAELITDFAAGLAQVEVVPQELGRVLLNLYNNAFYAVQQRQQAGEADYRPTLTVSTHQQNRQVEIRVRDNGMGIPDAVKAKIFQPFFTTKPTGQGTGLGLSLSYDIVTKGHKGTLTAESQPDKGTTFIVTLPT